MKKSILVLAIISAVIIISCGTAQSGSGDVNKRTGPFSDKRGVAYSFEQDETYWEDMALLAPGVKWFYNKYFKPHPEVEKARKEHNVAYYPMIWTNWGFIKHNWVAVKWALLILQILVGTFVLGPAVDDSVIIVDQLRDSAFTDLNFLSNTQISKIVGSVQTILLLFVVVISVQKPFKKKTSIVVS